MFFKSKKTKDITIKHNFILYFFKISFIFFVIILVYIITNFIKIFNSDTVKIYEVNAGEIVNVDRHKGFIYRDEDVTKCVNSGYINFFVTNADRVNRGALIYTINDTLSDVQLYDLNDNDRKSIKENINLYTNSITNYDFSNIYIAKNNLNSVINEISVIKQLENVNFESEIDAKEKNYSRCAGLVAFVVDGYEEEKIENFNDELIKKFTNIKYLNNMNEVNGGDKVYKIIKNPEFVIVFDSSYDYDNYKNNFVRIKFVNENINTNGRIESFIGNDNKKHFKLKVSEYPERFIDKRVVEFEIENKMISGYKIPIKSITSKNCYIIPKNIVEKDTETNENIIYKVGINGQKEKITCNISKEDNDYCYISIDDTLSKLKFGDVLSNRYNDNYSLSEVVKLDGVYNMNKGYAVFKNVDVIDRTNEYAIIKKQTINGISLYDHIALDANDIGEGDLIS